VIYFGAWAGDFRLRVKRLGRLDEEWVLTTPNAGTRKVPPYAQIALDVLEIASGIMELSGRTEEAVTDKTFCASSVLISWQRKDNRAGVALLEERVASLAQQAFQKAA
jgi:hypothetical protein